MTLPNGIDQATWERCLINFDLWKPGQLCETRDCGHLAPSKLLASSFLTGVLHDAPAPEPTPDLLWRIFKEGLRVHGPFYESVHAYILDTHNLAAAVILASAAIGAKG